MEVNKAIRSYTPTLTAQITLTAIKQYKRTETKKHKEQVMKKQGTISDQKKLGIAGLKP